MATGEYAQALVDVVNGLAKCRWEFFSFTHGEQISQRIFPWL